MDSYSSVEEINFSSSDLYPIATAIDSLPNIRDEIEFAEEEKEKITSSVKVFINENFNFHNIFSVYRNSASFRMFRRHPNSSSYPLPSIKKDLVLVDPLRIPVRFILDDIGSGDVDYRVVKLRNNTLFICLGIELPKQTTILTPSTYIHELTHTQLANSNTVSYSFNDELLSILMEFIYIIQAQSDTNLYQADRNLRAKDFVHRVGTLAAYEQRLARYDSFIKEESIKYSVSTLQAFHLVMLYDNGDASFKKEMLKNIQRIFDRRITVEDFLDIYHINLSTMLNEDKLIKYLKK